jgi:hypothetical protein
MSQRIADDHEHPSPDPCLKVLGRELRCHSVKQGSQVVEIGFELRLDGYGNKLSHSIGCQGFRVLGVFLVGVWRGQRDEGISRYTVSGFCNSLAIMPLATRSTIIVVKTAR